MDSLSPLVVLQGTLMACKYVDDILQSVVLFMLSNCPGLFNSKTTLGYILRDSCNNIYKDIISFYELQGHHILLQESMFRTCWEEDFSRIGITTELVDQLLHSHGRI